MEMTGADGREFERLRALHVDDAACCEVALEGARCFLFDLSPSRVGDGGEFPMEIIHDLPLLFSEPIPSEPSGEDNRDFGASSTLHSLELGAAFDGAAVSVGTSSRNVADGTKNSVPVTARL